METKVCKKCGRELPVEEFYKTPGYKDGLDSVCKECRKDRMKENYKARKSENVRRKESLPFNVDDKTGGGEPGSLLGEGVNVGVEAEGICREVGV